MRHFVSDMPPRDDGSLSVIDWPNLNQIDVDRVRLRGLGSYTILS